VGVYRGDTEEERGGDSLERKSSGVHCVRDLRFGRFRGCWKEMNLESIFVPDEKVEEMWFFVGKIVTKVLVDSIKIANRDTARFEGQRRWIWC
jgi:hypothetical protein